MVIVTLSFNAMALLCLKSGPNRIFASVTNDFNSYYSTMGRLRSVSDLAFWCLSTGPVQPGHTPHGFNVYVNL